ncbi:hypothetical protein Tco_0834522 [Tanacetum coccineum]
MKIGVETKVPPKITQALLARQRERKAKSILFLAIPDEYQLRFHAIKDLKTLWATIKKGLDKAYDRIQKLISLLEVHALIMRNKAGIDDLDIDDLYNNLKMFEADIKGSSGSSSNSQNVAFLSAEDTSSRYRRRDNTRRTILVETSDALVVQDNALIVQDGLGYDWSYIAQDEPTEFALMAYTLNSSGSDTEVQSCFKNYVKTYEKLQKQFDEQRQTLSKANLEIIAYQLGLESVEAQLVVHQKNEAVYDEKITVLEFEVKDKRYGDQLNENDSTGSELFNSVFDSRSSDGDDNQTNDKFKKDNEYHVVPPPLTGNYMPPLADLSFTGLDDSVYRPTTNKTSASVSQVETSITPPSNTSVEIPRVELSLKIGNESVKPKQAKKPRITTQNPKVDRRDWNGKMT